MGSDRFRRRWLRWLAGAAMAVAGCAAGPDVFECEDGECGPEPGSEQWWAQKAQLPVGARQRYHKGKLWPPFPRPTEEQQQCSHIYHAAHYWPHPYNCQDQAYVRQLWAEQSAAGWIDATTFYDYHFVDGESELTGPGRAHLRWILKSIPDQRRMAFVQSASTSEISQARLQAVQTAAQAMVSEADMPPIILRDADTPGRPAIEVDAIRQGELATLPSPRLTGGGSGGGIDTSGLSGGGGGGP